MTIINAYQRELVIHGILFNNLCMYVHVSVNNLNNIHTKYVSQISKYHNKKKPYTREPYFYETSTHKTRTILAFIISPKDYFLKQ